MDLHTIEEWVVPSDRRDLALLREPDAAAVAGGTWLFADQQVHLKRLVDLAALGWPALTPSAEGLVIAATCTVAELVGFEPPPDWTALLTLVPRCASALASSPKIWDQATVGGNVAVGLPAGAMTSLLVALDGVAHVWRADGSSYDVEVADLVTGVGRTCLGSGDVIRSFRVGLAALTGGVAFRRAALAAQGRTGTIVVARRDQGSVVLGLTGGTTRPHRLVVTDPDDGDDLDTALGDIDDWLTDHHGSARWRAAMTSRLAQEAVHEVTGRGTVPA